MAIRVIRPTYLTTIDPTLILPDIILTVLIWDGVVTRGINIAPITIISIGATIDQVIIARNTIMAISEAINGIAMVNTIENIVGKVTMHNNGGDKLAARIGGHGKMI